MGQFVITIKGTGNHGCMRGAADGEHVLGCQRPDCVDCIAREVVRRLQRNGVTQLEGQLVHWPDPDNYARWPDAAITDNLVTGVRTGSFSAPSPSV